MQSDNRTSVIVQILDICKNGAKKSVIIHKLSFSNSQLRRISAELVDKGSLQFSEPGLQLTKVTSFSGSIAKITGNSKIRELTKTQSLE
jgi:predicted transcriptional regulator